LANGERPTGFSTAVIGGGGPPFWVIVEDFTAPGAGKVLVPEADDPTLQDAGKIGLWTKADSLTYFTDLSVNTAKAHSRKPRGKTNEP
jgi:hypothetical protein